MGQTMYNGILVQTEDCTPTWEAVLPIYLEAYSRGNKSSLDELFRMAKELDKSNKKFQMMQNDIQDRIEHRAELVAQIEKLNETIEIMDDEKNMLGTKLHDLESMNATLTKQNESLKKVNRVMIELCNKQSKQLKSAEIEGLSYKNMVKNLESRLNDLETELEYFKNAQE